MILYPLLFAVYPVLFLYAHNIKELHLSQLTVPLIFSLVFASITWGILYFVLKDKIKSAVSAAILVVLFFSYGHFFDLIHYLGRAFGVDFAYHLVWIPFILILWGYLLYRLKRTKKDLQKLSGFLNIAAIALVLFNVVSIGLYEIKRAGGEQTVPASAGHAPPVQSPEKLLAQKQLSKENLPDIYYIILDGYASLHTIKTLYNYDNSEFARQLEEEGFYIAPESRTRYNLSERCMASSLNMSLVEESQDPYAMLRQSKVVDVLKNHGYTVACFPIGHQTAFKKADRVFDYSERKRFTWISDFNVALVETTMLRKLYQSLISEKYHTYFYREKTLYMLETLESLPETMKGPKFVYAHIMSPHWPFVFDRDGGLVDFKHFADINDKKYYLDQYIFISKRILQTIHTLKSKSKIPPVIILQSDHGPRGIGPKGKNYTLKVGNHWQRIFNSYYLPGKDNAGLYPSISPYNTFRLIFNLYLKTDYPMLKEAL